MPYKDKERNKLCIQKYYQDHKEELKLKRKQYYQENKAIIYQKSREYIKNNKDKMNIWKKQYRKDNPSVYQKELLGGRHRKLQLRKEVISHYSNNTNQCACCGESIFEFLTLDHINGGGSKHKKSLGGSLYRWLKNQGFPEGYQILCWNCNATKGLYGQCPHKRTDN